MSRPRRAAAPSTHRYPRTARLNESLREVIAEELTRIDDERLDMVTITAIDVDAEMNRAIVFFDSLVGEDGDPLDPRGAEQPPGAHPGIDRPSGPRQEDADPDLQARRGHPVGRAHPAHPDASDTLPSGPSRTDDATTRPPRSSDSRRRRRWPGVSRPTVHGLAVVDKPAGVTSHDVVGMHAPPTSANGGSVMPARSIPMRPACCSSASATPTRLLRFLTALGKRYTAEVVLGHRDIDARLVGPGDRHPRHERRHARPGSRASSPST